MNVKGFVKCKSRMMKKRVNGLRLQFLLLFVATVFACRGATGQDAKPQPVPLSDAILSRLPANYREEVKSYLQMTPDEQQKLAAMPDEELDSQILRQLARRTEGIGFLLLQLEKEPSPNLRSQIIRSLVSYWQSRPEEQQILEHYAVADPDAGVSLTALDTLRSIQTSTLNTLLEQRWAEAEAGNDLAGFAKLDDENQQRLLQRFRAVLPAFLRIPPPLFSVVPPGKSIRVLAFGDFGTGTVAQIQTAAAMVAYDKAHPFDFGITLGDNFYYKGMVSPDDPRWQTQWEQLYGPMGIKFYAVLGNHDWFADSPAAEILYTAKSPTWRMPAMYYTFTAGPVQFFAFDTSMMDSTELEWLDDALSKSTAQWKVVYGHYHIFSAGFGGGLSNNTELILRLLPILEKHHVGIYLCGHIHNLQEVKPVEGVHFFVSGGGGATLMNVNPYDRSAYEQKINGFTVLEADEHHFKVSFIGIDGKELYQDTLTK